MVEANIIGPGLGGFNNNAGGNMADDPGFISAYNNIAPGYAALYPEPVPVGAGVSMFDVHG